MRRFIRCLLGKEPDSTACRANGSARRSPVRLTIEPLEDRLAPALMSWINPVGGSWHTAANWFDGAVSRLPGIGDDVVIPDLAGTQTILHDSGTTEIASLVSAEKVHLSATTLRVSGNVAVTPEFILSGQAALFGATVLAGTTVTVLDAADLYGVTINGSLNAHTTRLNIRDGLTINGTMGISTGIREDASLLRMFGTQTIGGTGTIHFSGTFGVKQLLVNTAATTVTVGPGVTIRGTTALTSNFADSMLVLQGTVTAAGGDVVINAPNWRNEGILEVLGGARLILQNTWSTGGSIRSFGTGQIGIEGTGNLLANTVLSAESGSNVGFGGTLNLAGRTLELSGTGRFELPGTLHGGTLNQTNGAIVRAAGGTLSGMTLNGNLDVVGGSPNNSTAIVTISNGLTLNGTASVGSGNSTSGTIRLSNTQTIGGTGAISFGGGNVNQLMLITNSNVTVTFAPGFTIRGGGGRITSTSPTSSYVFQGRVAADRPDGGNFGTIVIHGVNWRNDGVMEAGANSTLQLTSNWTNNGVIRASGGSIQLYNTWTQAGTLSASAGTIDVDGSGTWLSLQPLAVGSGSNVILRGDLALALPLSLDGPVPFTLAGTLMNGTVNVGGGGYLDASGGTLNSVSLNGNLTVFNTSRLTLTNGLTLAGQMSVSFGGMVRLIGQQTISGGTIRFGGESGNTFDIVTDNSLVTVGSFVTGLRGTFASTRSGSCYSFAGIIMPEPGGTIGVSCLDGGWSITNTGTMIIESSSVSTPDSLSTAGNIRVGANGFLSVNGALTQTGGATTLTAGNAVLTASSVVLDGGTLAGIGTVNAPVTNGGQVSPGASPGILTLNGAYTQSAAGSLAIELNGVAAGTSHDQLRVNGAVALNGALQLSRGFASAVGDTFLILANDGSDPITGTFTDLPEGGVVTAGGMRFQISYQGGTGNDVVLTHINTAPLLDAIVDKMVIEGTLLTFTARATDVDAPPQSVAFSLDPGAPAGATIDPTTGIFAWTPAPSQAPGAYSVTVRASDNGLPPLSDARMFTVTVLVSNQAPTAIAVSSASVAENEPIGTSVGAFSTTDPDSGDTFTYGLVTGNGDADNGSFTIASGNLKSAASLDFEAKPSYSIRVRSTDAGGLSVEKVFTISVTNINETPTDIPLSNARVAENQPIGTVVGALGTTDPDAGDTFTYALVSGTGDADNAAFTIDVAANLKAAASFDFETKSSYTVRVRSTDAGGLSTEKVFTISVTNVNEAPTLTVPGAQTAFEDVDQTIGGVSVDDVDGGSLTVTLAVGHGALTVGTTTGLTVSGNGGDAVSLAGSIANLNAALASLVYRGSLNFSGSDTLSITANDGSLSTTGSVAITVKSAAQQASDLQAKVTELRTAGVLNHGRTNSLIVKLNLKGNAGDVDKVQSFLDHVWDFLDAGILTQAQADDLLNWGNILLLSVSRR